MVSLLDIGIVVNQVVLGIMELVHVTHHKMSLEMLMQKVPVMEVQLELASAKFLS
jgi:hypothetical protein